MGSWLESVIRAAFSTRRKQVWRALAEGLELKPDSVKAALVRLDISPTARAEELAPERFPALALELSGPDRERPTTGVT
ncbi:MAG: hypothetical protein HY815_32540 [Candidatus Riflebacteria bacterium]|nr:hypothetical protein [Candidatus Riflebacteria bacterium]